MTLSDNGRTSFGTTMASAFEESGYSPDLIRLRAVILDSDGSHSALWLKIKNDKALAIAAMGVLDEWARSAPPLVKVVPRPAAPPKTPEQRAETKKAIKVAALKLVKVAEAKAIQRAIDGFRLVDGSLLAKRHWYELNHIARRCDRDGKIIRAVTGLVRPPNDKALVGDVISPDQFDKILKDVGP